VIAFLTLFVDLARTHSLKSGPLLIPASLRRALYFQFRPKSAHRFVLTLEVLCLTSGHELFKDVRQVMLLLNTMYYTHELFDRVLTLLPSCPQVYPICCLLAIQFGDRERVQVARGLFAMDVDAALSAEIVEDSLWPLWPMLLLLKLDRKGHIFLHRFFVKVLQFQKPLERFVRPSCVSL
jgi:hypothetical protein